MAVLSDNTVSGAGEISGYQPFPLTLYVIITNFDGARSHDIAPNGRWFDVGWFAPFFLLDPVGLGTEQYQFDATFIPFQHSAFSLHQFAGGFDGIHYDLQGTVQCRFILTDD